MEQEVELSVYNDGEDYCYQFAGDEERRTNSPLRVISCLARWHLRPEGSGFSPYGKTVFLEDGLDLDEGDLSRTLDITVATYNNWVRLLAAAKTDIEKYESEKRVNFARSLEKLAQEYDCCEIDEKGLVASYALPENKMDNVEMEYPGNGM